MKAPSNLKKWIRLALKTLTFIKPCYSFHPFSLFLFLFPLLHSLSLYSVLMPTPPHLQFPLSLASVRDRASSPYPTFSVLKSSLGLVSAGCRAQLPPHFSNLTDILSFLNKNSFGKSDARVLERLTLWPQYPDSYPFLIFFNHFVNSKTDLSKALFK